MYQNISGLKRVYMNATKNGKITSMKSTFEYCKNIKWLIIDGFNTKKIESMNRLFYGTNISITDIEGLETNNFKDMSFILEKTKVEFLNLSNFITNKVTNMSHMFYETSIKNLILLNCDTSNLQDMSHLFENSKDLAILNFNNFKTSNVLNMNLMFEIVLIFNILI